MTFREFSLPEYHEFVDALGVGPDAIEGEDAQVLRFEGADETLTVTLDVLGRSVHCRWTRGGSDVLELVREGAVSLRPTVSGGSVVLSIYFETDNLKGELELQVGPTFAVRDQLLFA